MQNPEELCQLAKSIAYSIEPVIPYLIVGTQKAAEEAGKKVGTDAWEKVKNMWGMICSKEKTELKEAAGNMVLSPADTEAKKTLIQEIRKLLEENPELAKEIESVMKDRVVQKIIAEDSSIKNVRQNANGKNKIRQEVIARNSTVENLEQTQNARY